MYILYYTILYYALRIVNILYYNYSKSRRKTNQMQLNMLCTIKFSSNSSDIYYYFQSREFDHWVHEMYN